MCFLVCVSLCYLFLMFQNVISSSIIPSSQDYLYMQNNVSYEILCSSSCDNKQNGFLEYDAV